jgi:serine/threonine-protein kinase
MSIASVQPGEIIGPYRVVKEFRGQGGMAQICEVEVREKYATPGVPKRLALKIADEEHQPALVAEADYLRRFNHPNVVRIYPLPGRHKETFAARKRFDSGWGWYYAMELLEAGSLEERLTQTGMLTGGRNQEGLVEKPIPLAQAWGIAHQLTYALEHIHSRSVINLDVKPANILFRRRPPLKRLGTSIPEAVLSDFGIARDPRHPRFGILGVATPEYVSPEHTSELRGQNVPLDGRADLFSLGIVLYEMLTGRLPFEDLGHIIAPQYMPPPPSELRRGIPAPLEEVVMRALQKNPDYRYQSAAEMRSALEGAKRPTDWVAIGRRMFAAVAITAGLTGGYQVYDEYVKPTSPPTTPHRPTSTSAPAVVSESVTPTLSPTVTPSATTTATEEVGAVGPTSTPKPTSTPTPTFPPPTPTPTSTPGAPAPDAERSHYDQGV